MQKSIVYVGLSGGVDSAVSAALLKKQGYTVVGVFIKAWTPVGFPCTWREDRRSAMRAAAVLDIPFKTLDLEKEYKEEVVDYMIREYKVGRTPNPDVMCNKEIKFGKFLDWALKEGADFVATGHYAQNISGTLTEGRDKNKDQSYFLWTLTKDQLAHTLFPIGHLEKSEVRKLAESFNLPQATRKDSQGLCFLGKIDMKEFLSLYIEHKEGDVLHTTGEKIGTHHGALFFTLGERHGFTITKKTESDLPYYVVAKDIEKNTITVAHKTDTPEYSKSLTNTLTIPEPHFAQGNKKEGEIMSVRIRYRGQKLPCTINYKDKALVLTFESPLEPVAEGQSIVFYNGERCLGGGIMSRI